MKIDTTTPLAMLTIGQLDEFLSTREKSPNLPAKRYVYGLAGICSLFGCRTNTAQKLKKEIIAEAVTQRGRKIMVDVDLALQLYRDKK